MSTALRITPSALDRLIASDPTVRLIDVRTSGEFEAAHIPGSYNVPLDQLGEHRHEIASVSAPVVLICQSGARATKAETELQAAGMTNLRLLDGGMNAWSTHGGSTNTVKVRWGLERQVRLVAGLLVAVAIVVSIWAPWTRFIAGAVGAGLTFAATTNTCAMGMMLAKLPYNRGSSCDITDVVSQLQPGKVTP
jgi:rhodanese-related sulfurtransferase